MQHEAEARFATATSPPQPSGLRCQALPRIASSVAAPGDGMARFEEMPGTFRVSRPNPARPRRSAKNQKKVLRALRRKDCAQRPSLGWRRKAGRLARARLFEELS
jgi:hypothetical protein